MKSGDDQADVDRILNGDLTAIEGIVDRWQGPLINLAYRFCRDRSRAEEMAQEALFKAYRNLAQWNRQAAFSTWLFAIAVNTYRSELRRFPANTVGMEDASKLADRHFESNVSENKNRDEVVRRAVSVLPAKYRDVLILFYFRDMNVSETAQCLRIANGTVKARLARARKLLNKKLTTMLFGSRIEESECSMKR